VGIGMTVLSTEGWSCLKAAPMTEASLHEWRQAGAMMLPAGDESRARLRRRCSKQGIGVARFSSVLEGSGGEGRWASFLRETIDLNVMVRSF
jgi:hypothetical protein